jgi:hypothetical protein
LLYVAVAVLKGLLPLFASSMCCNRRSFVFYDVVILLIVILLVSAMMNGCGFSYWSYQVFHLRYLQGNFGAFFLATALVTRLCALTLCFRTCRVVVCSVQKLDLMAVMFLIRQF